MCFELDYLSNNTHSWAHQLWAHRPARPQQREADRGQPVGAAQQADGLALQRIHRLHARHARAAGHLVKELPVQQPHAL